MFRKPGPAVNSLNRLHIFVAISAAAFAFAGVRSYTVPVSHDEAVTFFLYVQTGTFLPHNMIWDANNHILNSALMYPLWKIFGANIFFLRLPNLAAFPVYAFFVYGLLRELRLTSVFVTGAAALLSAPFLIDFFAQARGYGMSMAAFAGALYFMSRYFSGRQPRQQWPVWLCFWITLTANMSMVNSYLIALGLTGLMMVRLFRADELRKHLLPYFTAGVLPFAAFAAYAAKMRAGGLLYYGERDGFIEVTVRTLNRYVFYADHIDLARAVAAIGLVFGGYQLLLWVRRKLDAPGAGVLSAVFLLGNAVGAVLLCHLLEVNYPEDRTALYFVPLFMLAAAFFFDDVSGKVPRMKYAALSLAAFPALTVAGTNIGYTRLWKDLHLHPGLYDFVAERHPPGEVSVESYFLTASSWAFRSADLENPLPPVQSARHARGRADYAVCHEFRCDPYAVTHDTVYKDPRNETYLMARRTLAEWRVLKVSDTLPAFKGKAERFDFFVSEDAEILGRLGAVDITLRAQSESAPLLCDIVITAADEKGKMTLYDFTSLNRIREEWRGDTLSLTRMVHLPEGSTKLVCYVRNLRKAEVSIDFDRIILREAVAE